MDQLSLTSDKLGPRKTWKEPVQCNTMLENKTKSSNPNFKHDPRLL